MNMSREDHLKVLKAVNSPVVKIVVTVFKIDPDNIDAPPQYLVGYYQPFADDFVRHRKFPSDFLFFDEDVDNAALRIVRDAFPGVKASLVKMVHASSRPGLYIPANLLLLHYVFAYESGVPRMTEKCEQFSWLNADQIQQLSDVAPYTLEYLSLLNGVIADISYDRDEILVEVDRNNREIGSISKIVAHRSPTRFHRAIHVLVFNSDKHVVLQLRSHKKERYGGKWAYHGGHVAYGQTPLQTATHELMEELGIDPELHFHALKLYETEHESQYTYSYYAFHDGSYSFNRNEVDAVKAFDPAKLIAGEYDEQYIILPWVKVYLEEMRHVWQTV